MTARSSLTAKSFAAVVDHTLLAASATRAQVVSLCQEAVKLQTAAVCVNALWVSTVAEELAGSGVRTCAVAGFPLGADPAEAVAATVRIAIEEGADEIDIVNPLGYLLAGEIELLARHLQTIREAADGTVLKVIIESAVLSDDQIVQACRVAVDAGADFVKTSTGFHPSGGASVEAVRLMRASVGTDIGVKASGGIRDLATVTAMLDAGASRLGMSATAAVIAEIV